VVILLAVPTGASTYQTPVWSPGGGRIAFVRREGGIQAYTLEVEMVRIDGSDLVSLWQGPQPTPFLPIVWRP